MERATALCAACRAPVAADARFCSRCGAPQATPGGGEARKVVTALFADVVGSTPLAERLDPEDFRAVIGAMVAVMTRAVEHFGGTVEHVAGDGLLGLFGAPSAHEDDAERAVLAGLQIVAEVEEEPAVRVGIETGLVVVGPLAGTALTAMGDSVNTAARLQAAASAGTVLVGERTVAMVQGAFEWGERSTLQLKGKAEPVGARRAVRPVARVAGRETTRTPLVGRSVEVESLRQVLREARAARGGVLVLSGEPGMGKSRLVRELNEAWRRELGPGAPWIGIRGVSYGRGLPYHPFRGLLEGTEVPDDLRPLLAPLLGDAAPAADVSGAATARRMAFGAMRALLERRAAGTAVALAVDDVHWVDSSSALLLEHLIPAACELSLTIVLAARPGEEPSRGVLEAAQALPGDRVRVLSLGPLAAEADRELLARLIGAGTLPARLEQRVLERAEGNPFYLEEMVRTLRDTGALVSSEDGLRFAGAESIEVPETVERLVLARVDRLSPLGRELLGAASVLGRQFGAEQLEWLSGPPDAESVDELQRQALLVRGERAGELRFGHALIQEAVYRSLLRAHRRELHGRAAAGIEAVAPGRHGLLAHHWSAAGDHERAAGAHARAGQAALAVYSLDEAMEHSAEGLDDARRVGLDGSDPCVRALRRLRGETLFVLGDQDAARTELETSLADAREAGDRGDELASLTALGQLRDETLALVAERGREALELAEALGDTEAIVHALCRLTILQSSLLRLDLASVNGRRARELAESAGDERLLGRALDATKLVALMLGDLNRLEGDARRAARIHRRQHDPFFLSWALLEAAYVPIARARFDEAERLLGEALSLNERVGGAYRGLFLDARCWLERSRGAFHPALAAGEEALRHSRNAEVVDFVAWAAAGYGWALLEAGDPARAATVLREGLDAAERSGAGAQVVRCAGVLARAVAQLEGPEAAEAHAGRAERAMASATYPVGGAFLLGAHAQIALASVRLDAGQVEAARRLATPVVYAARTQGWLENEARAALVLASCAVAEGDEQSAGQLARSALRIAESGPLPGVGEDARQTLAGLGAPARGA